MADDGIDLGDLAQAAVAIAVAYAAQAALNSLSQGKQSAVSQSFPSQLTTSAAYIMVGGKSRIPGLTVLKEVADNKLGTIQAFHAGRVADTTTFYLNEDKVTVDGSGWVTAVYSGGVANTDGRYVDNKVQITFRNGLPTETAMADFVSTFPTIWTAAHRGDNTASAGMMLFRPKAKFIPQAFPAGPPTLNIVTQPADFYDWRQDSTAGGAGSQRRDDPSTWDICENPVICRVHLEWYRWGRSWDRCIAPVLADLTAEANLCDAPITLAAGGTEPRYRCAGWYVDSANRDEVRQRLDAAMDGFCTTDGRGRLIVKCGHYEEPTFILPAEYIEDYTWSRGVSRDVRVSSFNPTFTDPASDYATIPCDAWVIDPSGTNPQPLSLDWVPSFTQARRLAKRAAARANPAYSGQIRTGPYGFNGMGRRYIRIQNPVEASMADVVCEVTNVEFDPVSGQVVFDVISADINIDAWNPATEEGAAPVLASGLNPGALTAPTIDTVTPFYDGTTVRLRVTATGPNRTDLTWFSRWRVTGATAWNDPFQGDEVTISGGQVYFNTGVVTASSSIDVETYYRTGDGTTSPNSTTFVANSSVVPPAWADAGALWQAELTSSSNRLWTGNTVYASLAAAITASAASFSRSGTKWAANAAGTYSSISSGNIAMTDQGAAIEPAETNSIVGPDAFSNAAWTVSGASKTAGQTTPFGSDGALVTANGASSTHYITQGSLPSTNGTDSTVKLTVKAGTATRVQVTLGGAFNATNYANFNLSGGGSVSQSAIGTGSIKLVGANYEITYSVPGTSTGTSAAVFIAPLLTGTETRLPTLTTSGTFYVLHAEYKVGAGAGTPITGSSRNADALNGKFVPGTYTVTVTYSDATTDVYTSQVITGSGWTVPTKLNSYITKIVGS